MTSYNDISFVNSLDYSKSFCQIFKPEFRKIYAICFPSAKNIQNCLVVELVLTWVSAIAADKSKFLTTLTRSAQI